MRSNAMVCAAAVVGLAVFGGCRDGKEPTKARPAPVAVAAARTSALTSISHTGWTASASQTLSGYAASKAIDSDSGSRWTNGDYQTTQWFKVDFGAVKAFTEVEIWSNATDYPRQFNVQVSNNNSTWTTVASATGTSALVQVPFAEQQARYVRIQLATSGQQYWFSIYDFNVYSTQHSTAAWAATSSGVTGSDTEAKAIDSSLTTKWTSSTNQSPNSQWFQVDMRKRQTFSMVSLDGGATSNTTYPRGYKIESSDDASTWTTLATGTGTAGGVIFASFTTTQARYLKVTQTGTASVKWSLYDFLVYGQPEVPSVLSQVGWTATASKRSSEAGGAIDSVLSTGWSNETYQAVGDWFQVDMGTSRTVSGITMDSELSNDYARGFNVYVSDDPMNWGSPAGSGTGTSPFVTATFAPKTGRYVKVQLTSVPGTSDWWGFCELNIQTPGLARAGWIVRASSTGGTDEIRNAFDNNSLYRWTSAESQETEHWVTADMVTQQTFNKLTLDASPSPSSAGNYPRSYEVYVSNDGTNWGTAVATGTGSSQSISIAFASQTARYIKVRQPAATGVTNPWSIHELEVFREAVALCDTVTCTASDQCHDVGTCDPGTGLCSNPLKTNGTSCNDGNACTQTDTCQAGTCTGGNPVTCTASDQCHTAGTCNTGTGVCSNPAKTDGSSCSDGNACTQTDTCQAGTCTGANAVTCTASDQCHDVGTCNTGTGVCSNPAKTDGTTCSDGNACTQTDTCVAGACTGGNGVTCTASDQCHVAGTCDPGTGACSNPAKANGSTCSDGNACTQSDTCQTGACVGASPIVCTAINQCHTAGTCNPATGACSDPLKATGTACNDSDLCTTNDVCTASGLCAGTAQTCAPSDSCHAQGTCNPSNGVCSNPPQECATNHRPHFTSTPVTHFVRGASTGQARPFDLHTWSVHQYELFDQADANWVIDSTGTVATQTINADSSVLLSDVPVGASHIEGTWSINSNSDDDLVGFVFGWQDPTHFYLFDWKMGDQGDPAGFSQRGMSVKRVNASSALGITDVWPTAGNGTRVVPLYHNTIPWARFQPYAFTLDYVPGHFTITVKQGSTVLATIDLDDSTYPSGKFGFYNYSQDGVAYSGFSNTLLPSLTYRYDSDATDPDGNTLTYSLLTAPSGMTIDPATGVITWDPPAGDGAYSVSAQVSDPSGLTDVQTFTVLVDENDLPIVNAGPDQQVLEATFPALVSLAGSVDDELPNTDPSIDITWTKVSGPGTVTFSNASSPTSTALFSDPGSYVLQLAASDGIATATDFVTIYVDTQPSLSGATVNLVASSAGPLVTGTSLTLTATVRNSASVPMKNVSVRFDIAGANGHSAYGITNASGVATYTYVGGVAGSDVPTVTALGAGGAPTATLAAISWTSAPPSGPPVATQGWIGGPAHQSTVSGQVPITVAAGSTLTSGTVTYWPLNAPDQVHTLATGVTGGPGSTIATLDTTVLPNGPWVIKLDATNSASDQRVSLASVTVTGDYKPGRVVVEQTDMTIPLVGLPITVGRRYDSLEKDNVGDFGHGWSLMLGHPRLEVDPAHNVTITMPDNRRVTFYFQATSLTASAFFAWLYGPGYVPEAGTYGSLKADGCPMMVLNGGQLVCFLENSLEYAPTTYTYTDPYGRVFVMAVTGELKSITDRQGNKLTFTPTGIASSTGVGVTFERDLQGRIKKITSPALDALNVRQNVTYTYDTPAGDLTKVTLANELSSFDFTYEDHRLLTTRDPLGNPVRTSTYDSAGRLETDTDALSNVTSYAYDLTARKTTTTNPDTGTVQQWFDARGLLLKEIDPLNRATEHTYDPNRNELTRKNALNEVTTFTYDGNGNQKSIAKQNGDTTHVTYNQYSQPETSTDANGFTSTILYDDRGIPTTFFDEDGTLATFTSSDKGLPLTVTDAAGKTAHMTYDDAGNLKARSDRLGRTTRNLYDGVGRLTQVTDARGGVTKYSYSILGPRTQVTVPTGVVGMDTRTTTYDLALNVISEGGDGGRVVQYEYDAMNRLKKVTNADLTTREYTRDFRGNPLTEKDEAGRTTTYEYDKAGQLLKTTYPDETFTTRAYDDLGRLATATDERGNPTTYEYQSGCDCADRVTKVTDPLNRSTVTTYDRMSRRKTVTDAANHTTTYDYDDRGHLEKTTYADTTFETDVYDPRGRRTSHKDQMSSETTYGYDDEGQLTSVTDALLHVTRYAYDGAGNLSSVTDANNHTTSYEYDLLNRKTKRTLPLTMFETFAYNLFNDQTSHKDFRGKTTTMTYDERSRLLTKVPDPTLGEPTITFTYNPIGTRLSMADSSGTSGYTYDLRDRLLTKGTPAGTLTYTYDPVGNVATIRSSNTNGTFVDYAWDAANQLISVTDHRAGGITTAAYTATGRPSTVTQPSGVGATYSYDTRDRVSSLAWKRGTNPAFGGWSYGFNDRGQRTSVTDVNGRHVAYGYDTVSRLSSETVTGDTGGVNGAVSYALDAAGNRLSRTSTLAPIPGATYSYDANDQRSSEGYDLNGNATSSDGHTYTYDFENRVKSKDGASVALVYDGDGNRAGKTAGGVTTRYLVDDLNPTGYLQVLEEVSGGAVQLAYVYGTTVVSQRRAAAGGAMSYYGYDAHGNVAFLTDAMGNVTDEYAYDAWGNVLAHAGSTPNSRLYAGEEFVSDVGLLNLRARQYSAGAGRFLSIDPVSGVVGAPRTWNRYGYAGADPVNRIDPGGMADSAEEGGFNAGAVTRTPRQAVDLKVTFKTAHAEQSKHLLHLTKLSREDLQGMITSAARELVGQGNVALQAAYLEIIPLGGGYNLVYNGFLRAAMWLEVASYWIQK